MAMKTDKIWMNGKLVEWDKANIHICSHVIHYGSSVFEGARCYDTINGPAIFRSKEHYDRLIKSAKFFFMDLPYTREELINATKDLIKTNNLKECYIRPIVYRGYNKLGVNPLGNPVDVALIVWEWGAYLGPEAIEKGIDCIISKWRRISPYCFPTEAKAGGYYLNSQLARVEALNKNCSEAILLTIDGYVAEGSGENIFIVKDKELITPPIEIGILPGITRDSVIEIARDKGIKLTERNISVSELLNADEVFFTGTAAEITPIKKIDDISIGKGSRGAITKSIQETFFNIVKGKEEKYKKWLDYISKP